MLIVRILCMVYLRAFDRDLPFFVREVSGSVRRSPPVNELSNPGEALT